MDTRWVRKAGARTLVSKIWSIWSCAVAGSWPAREPAADDDPIQPNGTNATRHERAPALKKLKGARNPRGLAARSGEKGIPSVRVLKGTIPAQPPIRCGDERDWRLIGVNESYKITADPERPLRIKSHA